MEPTVITTQEGAWKIIPYGKYQPEAYIILVLRNKIPRDVFFKHILPYLHENARQHWFESNYDLYILKGIPVSWIYCDDCRKYTEMTFVFSFDRVSALFVKGYCGHRIALIDTEDRSMFHYVCFDFFVKYKKTMVRCRGIDIGYWGVTKYTGSLRIVKTLPDCSEKFIDWGNKGITFHPLAREFFFRKL